MRLDLSGVSVEIVMVCRDVNDINVATTGSLIDTVGLLREKGISYGTNIYIGGMLTGTRSDSVRQHLKKPYTHFFSVDSDIVWRAEDFLQILAYGTRYPVIGACYRAKRDTPFFLVNAEQGMRRDDFGCVPVNGMGMGFVCIQTPVLVTLSAMAERVQYPNHSEPIPEVFRFDKVGNARRGEDFAFYSDVHDLGYQVMLDPSIVLGHIGSKDYSGRFADVLRPALVAAE